MWVTGFMCVQHMCAFCIQLCHLAVVSHGQWVHTSCLSCPGAMWGHWREIHPLNWSVSLWCNFQSVSWWVPHCTCINWWFGSSLLGNRAWFHRLHHLCMLPHTSFCWGSGLKLVPTGSSGCTLCILRHEFPIPLGRDAEPLWPWHTPHRIQALTQGWAGYQ